MRSDENHLDWSPEQLLEVLVAKLTPNRLYYHCCYSGVIFENKADGDYIDKVVDVYALTGKYHIDVPEMVPELLITSGISKAGLEFYHKKNK